MKHSFLRFSVLTLCLLLCLSSLAACRDKGNPEDGKDTTAGDEVTTKAPRPVLPLENIPPLDQKIGSSAGDSLAGYTIDQLTAMWGSAVAEMFGERGYVWEMPNDLDYVIAYFDEDYYVTEMTYFSAMKATVVALEGDTVTVAPAAGEKELSAAESFSIPVSAFPTKTREKLAEGLTVYVTYTGTATANGQITDIVRADTAKPTSEFARF
jgi:hypothetical protein